MKKQILIVYHWVQGRKSGYGNVDGTVVDDISIKAIREMERQICKNDNLDSAVVLNIIELGKVEVEESEDTE